MSRCIPLLLSTHGWHERPPGALHARHDSSKSSRHLEIVASLLMGSSPCSTSIFNHQVRFPFNNSNGTSKHHRTGGTRPSLEQCHEELQNSSLATGLQDGSKGFKLTACCRPPSCWGMLLAAHSLQVQTLEVSWWFSPPLVCRPKKSRAWSLFLCLVRNISGKNMFSRS